MLDPPQVVAVFKGGLEFVHVLVLKDDGSGGRGGLQFFFDGLRGDGVEQLLIEAEFPGLNFRQRGERIEGS